MKSLKDSIVEIAEKNGWNVYIMDESNGNIIYDFGKCSPLGQDFHFAAEMENGNPYTLLDNIYERFNDFDASSETYLWLDEDGHGKNGAPYDMKDLYEDMESCQTMILELWSVLDGYAERYERWLDIGMGRM